jgi:endonuclease/exonuclease/phosphatase (EEP) superfamily protein YafD
LLLGLVGLAVIIAGQAQVARLSASVFMLWPYVVCAALLALVWLGFWLKGARKACIVIAFLLAVSFAWPGLEDRLANGSAPPRATPLKVISFNWRGDNPRHAEIYDWLRREQPDILSIQEFRPKNTEAARQLARIFPYSSIPGGSGDAAIWSRYPIKGEWSQQIYDRNYAAVRIAAPDGGVAVYAVHPETIRNKMQVGLRNAYFMVLAMSIDRRDPRQVMLGDFNATRWDPYFRHVRAVGRLHEQPWLFPPLTRLSQTRPVVGAPIDHILASRTAHISGCHTGPAIGSDHVPLICQVAFRAE